jgi:hypothetical protein
MVSVSTGMSFSRVASAAFEATSDVEALSLRAPFGPQGCHGFEIFFPKSSESAAGRAAS